MRSFDRECSSPDAWPGRQRPDRRELPSLSSSEKPAMNRRGTNAAPSLVIGPTGIFLRHNLTSFSRCSPARPFANSASRQPHFTAGRKAIFEPGFSALPAESARMDDPTAGDLFLALKGIDGSQPEKARRHIHPMLLAWDSSNQVTREGRDLSGRSCEYIVRRLRWAGLQ